jgi:hypothetical protein
MFKHRLSNRELTLFAVPLVLGLVCSSPLFRWLQQDELEKKARALAGPNAVNCGRIVIDDDTSSEATHYEVVANACAANAFSQGKSFFYRRERHNTNHLNFHFMVVGTKHKRVFQLWGKNHNVDKYGHQMIPDIERLDLQVEMKNGHPLITSQGWRKLE